MDILKIVQTLRPDLNICKVEGPTDWPDMVKQWWLFAPSTKCPGKNKCVGNILATSYYKEDETTECIMHKMDISFTIFE